MTSEVRRDALKRGLDLHKSGRLDEALTWYRAAIAIDADDAEANSLLGLALVHSGRGEEGLSHLRRAVELEPDQVPFRFNLVQGLQQAGAYPGAGDIAREQGDNDGAAAAWQRARQADPTATGPALKLASLEIEKSRFDAVLSLLDPIATAAAANEQIYELWCRALTGLRDWRALRATALSWVGSHPESSAARQNLARAEAELGLRRGS
jgi:tetratricopeptide (TPR) repeat protein